MIPITETNMYQQNILFDLDGTLTDPRLGITRSIQYALAKLGIDEPDLTRLEHFIGPPLLQAFMQFYGFDEAKAWEAVNFYRERFRVTGLYENLVFQGVPELLEALNGQGRTLYIATSKPWEFAREIARHFAFDHHFKVIYGSEPGRHPHQQGRADSPPAGRRRAGPGTDADDRRPQA